jgi:hypothetical protein
MIRFAPILAPRRRTVRNELSLIGNVMNTSLSKFPLRWLGVFLALSGLAQFDRAQAQPIIPIGVPEPGLVIWGSVVDTDNPGTPVPIQSVSWSVTDGSKIALYSATSRPATQIKNLNGQTFYILEIPFDTRRFGSITLNDPATEGIDSFELRASSPPTYTLTPTINGVLATVRAIDGAPAFGDNFPVAGFSTSTRGRVIRADLSIVPPIDDYETWATGIFGSPDHPDAARDADPDADGFTNDGEHAAGTDPLDPDSLLRVLTLTLAEDNSTATVGWQSVATKSYIIEFASSLDGPWSEVGDSTPGAGQTTETTVALSPPQPVQYFRVRVAP